MSSNKALVVIDVQNEYLEGGKLPLWNMEQTVDNIVSAIDKAKAQNIPIILVQHIANPEAGESPFFNPGTEGVNIHSRILAAAAGAPVVIKEFIDAFEKTDLDATLKKHEIDEVAICGMMTQSCVNHTAISKQAESYTIKIIIDCCTTLNEVVHNIALFSSSTRVPFITLEQL